MLFKNKAVQIPFVTLSIDDTYLRSVSKSELVERLRTAATALLALNSLPSTFSAVPRGVLDSDFKALTALPITASTIVGELLVKGSTSPTTAKCVTLDGKINTVKTLEYDSSVLIVSPVCSLLQLFLVRGLFLAVQDSDLTSAQRFERDRALTEIAAKENYIMSLDLCLWRAPEEVIASYAGAIYIRRLYNVVADGSLVDVISAVELPATIQSSGLNIAVARAQSDVRSAYPEYDTSEVTSYLEEAGVTAWLDPSSFKWLRLVDSLLITRRLRPLDLQVIEAEPDRMFFLLNELTRWAASADLVSTTQYISFAAEVAKVFSKLSTSEAIQLDNQFHSLAQLIESTYGCSGTDAHAIEAGVMHSGGHLKIDFAAPDAVTSPEIVELLTLLSLRDTPIHSWPVEFRQKLNFQNWTYLLSSGRTCTVSFQGPLCYRSAFVSYCESSLVWSKVNDTWSSLLTIADIVTMILAAKSTVRGMDDAGRYVQIEASVSKFYSRLLPFVVPASNAVVLPLRRFS